MSDEEVKRVFRDATIWSGKDLAASFVDLSDCLDEDGDPDIDKIYGRADHLVLTKPWLKAAKGSLGSDVPSGPTGAPVGSGRRRYGMPVLNEQRLRDKYKMDNA